MSHLTVYYDAACPICRRDRRRYERWAGAQARRVEWRDLNQHHDELRALGIHPQVALRSLHVKDAQGHISEGMDAYRLLLAHTPGAPLGWLIGLPGIKQGLRVGYDRWVKQRLKRDGRWSEHGK